MEEIDERHPQLLDALRTHPHIGFLMINPANTVRSSSVLTARYLRTDGVEGEDLLAASSSPPTDNRL